MLGMRKRTKSTGLFETIVKGLGDKGKRNDNLTSFMGGLLMRNVDPYAAAKLAMIANDNSSDPLPINEVERTDRKSTRLNSSHVSISYAVFCLKKKTNTIYTI